MTRRSSFTFGALIAASLDPGSLIPASPGPAPGRYPQGRHGRGERHGDEREAQAGRDLRRQGAAARLHERDPQARRDQRMEQAHPEPRDRHAGETTGAGHDQRLDEQHDDDDTARGAQGTQHAELATPLVGGHRQEQHQHDQGEGQHKREHHEHDVQQPGDLAR